MKPKRMLRIVTIVVTMSLQSTLHAQVSALGNNPPTGSWVGHSAANGNPVEVRHDGNRPIEFYTDGSYRMVLNETLTGQTVGSFTGLDLSGFLGVGEFNTGAYTRPVTRVHSDYLSTLTFGYRPMMGEGYLATRGESLCYTGLFDGLHAGVVWSTFSSTSTPPATFRFVYTGSDLTSTTSSSATGLELARFEPDASLNEGYFGIGDWTTAALSPTERLDVLDGRVRIRQLPDDAEATGDYWVMVVDKTASPSAERGVVKWVNAVNLVVGGVVGGPGANDCDWIVDPTGSTTDYDICTAYSSSACPWDNTRNVGIGMTTPFAKLDIVKDVTTAFPGPDIGIRLDQTSENWDNTGVDVKVHGTAQAANVGGRFEASNAGVAYGVQGFGGSASNTSYGLYGEAISSGPLVNYGVYGYADNGSVNSWAMYSQGRQFSTSAGTWTTSDAMFKSNIEDLTGALSLILQLQPKTYDFNTADYSYMAFAPEMQYGLLAQDVESVMPDVVMDVTRPADVDDAGDVVNPQLEFKALNYEALIPVLIGAIQEQNARIDQLEAQLNDCCSSDDGSGMMAPQGGGNAANGVAQHGTADEQLRIQPNPFSDGTTITYTLDDPGQVRLIVSTSGGKQLLVLQETLRSAGTFTYEWNTSDLASGVYNVMLLVDDAPMVQKAVKIQR